MKNITEKYEKQEPKKRILDYMTKIIKDGYTTIPQRNLAKALRMRRDDMVKYQLELVSEGKLNLEQLPNGKRKNPKYKYTLPIRDSYKSVVLREDTHERREMKLEGLGVWNIAERLDLIDMYLKSNLDIIPLVPNTKKRMFTDDVWNNNFRGDRTKVINFFGENATANVGVRMDGSFVCLDIDCVPQWLEKTMGETWDTLSSTSGKLDREHLWFANNTNITQNYPRVYGDLADILVCNNLVMVLPPSVHPQGTIYQWTNLVTPTDTPQFILDLFADKQNVSTLRELPNYIPTTHKRARRSAPRKELPNIIDKSITPETSRHISMFSAGRSWLRSGMKIDEISQKLVNYNKDCCKPPKSDKELRDLIRQIEYGTNRPDYKR